jgi:hypothetical protein
MGRHEAHSHVDDYSAGRVLMRHGRHSAGQPWYRDAKLAAVAAVVAAISMAATIVLLVTQPPGEAEIATAVDSAPSSANPHPATAAVRSVEPVRATRTSLPPPSTLPVIQQAVPAAVPRQVPRVDPPAQRTKAPQPRVSTPPTMSFAPKPVTPPQTAAPGTNQQRHGLLF